MRNKKLPRPRFRGSLLSRYLLIILSALLFIPVVFPASLIGYQLVQNMVLGNAFPDAGAEPEERYQTIHLENMWHKEAKRLKGSTPEEIDRRLKELSEEYSKVDMFWVDANSHVRQPAGGRLHLSETWNAADAISYMKRYREATQQFSVIAFIGDDEKLNLGFMVMQVSKAALGPRDSGLSARESMAFFGIILLMFVLFIVVSWMFFMNMRRRLLRLQSAMTVPDGSGLPDPITVRKSDEIGQLEAAFNGMVHRLDRSLKREREEEELRKRLIANLSHDLRTPLTVVRSHVYSLHKEQLSERGRELLKLAETKLGDLAGLIDNLLSYNLLTSGKYTLHPERVDVLRTVRESAAAWYPLWEKEGFEVDIDLPEGPVYWTLDAQWFRRILDNLFQNVVRHARSGQYIGVRAAMDSAGGMAIVIADKGKGMKASSGDKGAGIGLAIVGFLTREMGLDMEIRSTEEGTTILISRASGGGQGLKLK